VVDGSKGIMKEPSGASHDMNIKLGHLGEADPEIVKTTGQMFYNIDFSYDFGRSLQNLELLVKMS
jgi:hypothetical protein